MQLYYNYPDIPVLLQSLKVPATQWECVIVRCFIVGTCYKGIGSPGKCVAAAVITQFHMSGIPPLIKTRYLIIFISLRGESLLHVGGSDIAIIALHTSITHVIRTL